MRPDPSVTRLMFRAPAAWFAVALLVTAALCLLAAGLILARESAYERNGVRINGSIVSKDSWSHADTMGHTNRVYGVDLGFRPAGGDRVVVTEELSEARWRELEEGDAVEIVYLGADPSIARLFEPASSGDGPIGWGLAAIGAAAAVAGAWTLAWSLRAARRMRRLAREGEPAAAAVTEIRKTRIQLNNKTQYRLVYAYEDWRGARHQGESRLGPAERFETLAPGADVEVYVDRDDPAVSAWSRDLA